MKQKKIIIAAMLAFTGLSSTNATIITVSNNANSPGQYTSLQAAIDATYAGDIIEIEVTNSKKLGLVSYLTTVKSISEFQMILLATNKGYNSQSNTVKQFKIEYNKLKLAVDKLINQLSADMIVNNRLRKYKKINKYIKNNDSLPEKLLPYKTLITDIDTMILEFMSKIEKFNSKTVSTNEGESSGDKFSEEVIAIVELTHGIVTDARDFREKKVANIASLLGDLKLQSIKDLTETKEK